MREQLVPAVAAFLLACLELGFQLGQLAMLPSSLILLSALRRAVSISAAQVNRFPPFTRAEPTTWLFSTFQTSSRSEYLALQAGDLVLDPGSRGA